MNAASHSDHPPKSYFRGTIDPNPEHVVLDVRHVHKRFDERVVLDDVTFHVPRGEFLCLCGPNGAGKSTLLKSILGLIRPDAGEVLISGVPPHEARRRVGYVPQRKSFERDFPATPLEIVVAALRGTWPFFITGEEEKKAKDALARTGAEKLCHSQLRDLSGGETQRVFLARALVTSPELLVLDEPTAGVDTHGRSEIIQLLAEISRSEHLTAVLVTHNLLAVSKCAERVIYLERHVRAWGTYEELSELPRLTALHSGEDHDGD